MELIYLNHTIDIQVLVPSNHLVTIVMQQLALSNCILTTPMQVLALSTRLVTNAKQPSSDHCYASSCPYQTA